MKTILIITFGIAIQLFANYAYTNEKTVKIDMHGGNSEQYTKKSGFSKMLENKSFKGIGSMNIKEPTKPTVPKTVNIPQIKEIKLNNDAK